MYDLRVLIIKAETEESVIENSQLLSAIGINYHNTVMSYELTVSQ